LLLEFTVAPGRGQIDAIRKENAHLDLARWLSGDHASNNDWRPETRVSIMQRKTKRRPDASAAERRRAAPYTRPESKTLARKGLLNRVL
jgi:poly(3-hydroxyalkanoate) synthetase